MSRTRANNPQERKNRVKYRAYVAFHPFPDSPEVKIESILIIDSRNQIMQDFEELSPISDFIETLNESTVKRLLKQRFLDVFEISVRLVDIHILSFAELSKMLFKRANK